MQYSDWPRQPSISQRLLTRTGDSRMLRPRQLLSVSQRLTKRGQEAGS